MLVLPMILFLPEIEFSPEAAFAPKDMYPAIPLDPTDSKNSLRDWGWVCMVHSDRLGICIRKYNKQFSLGIGWALDQTECLKS